MTVTEIADEVQAQLLTAVQTVAGRRGHHARVGHRAGRDAPSRSRPPASRTASPQATQYVDRGFETVETWLRSQHDFATKVADALKPSADVPA